MVFYYLKDFDSVGAIFQIFAVLIVFITFKKGIWILLGYIQEKFRSLSENTKDFGTPEKDTVYLFQFHRTKLSPNSSPFCLKVETFLRYHKIPHKPIFTQFQRSKQGLLPFIIFNGKEIFDSNLIINELEKHFDLQPQLSSIESAIAQLAVQAIDNSLAKNVFNRLMPEFLASLSFKHVYGFAKNRLKSLHILSLPEENIYQGLKDNLRALDEILGEKKYLFGNEPNLADFALFSHLCTMYYTAYNQPLKDILDTEYPRLQKYIERTLTENFPEFRMYY
uniref:GST C-terminal domain-containing protein n=1 Tax=Panagrolaimus sp. PS1159 TaxID=55785 RepID=A0AC35F207_9BILA